MTEERIAKYLARCGLCSRRQAELWIQEGRIRVNGEIILLPQIKVTDQDKITCDGKAVKAPVSAVRLFLYYKPRGVLTTERDPEGRPTLAEALPKNLPRLVTIGRLDMNSEGLLLLTTSGVYAREMELPQNEVERVYHVRVFGDFTTDMQEKLKKGLTIKGVRYKPIETRFIGTKAKNSWIEFRLIEGKNREIRKVISYFGLRLNRLKRVGYGPYTLGKLKVGEVREVSSRE